MEGPFWVALTKKKIDKLKLPLMSQINKYRMQILLSFNCDKKEFLLVYLHLIKAKPVKLQLIKSQKRFGFCNVFPL